MRSQTLTARFELFVATATLAAHASAKQIGFRQRDVRFFTELFSNWSETDQEDEIEIQNVQIQRYLEFLTDEGWLKRQNKNNTPYYRLSRVGLLELLTRLVESKRPYRREHFLFLVFFVWSYHDRLQVLVRTESSQFPPSLRIELEALLDVQTLLDREIRRAEKQFAKLEVRTRDAYRTSDLVRGRLDNGTALDDVVLDLEKKIPYELNSRKPLSELISALEPDQRRWELVNGNRLRADFMWSPQVNLVTTYVRELKELKKRLTQTSGAHRL